MTISLSSLKDRIIHNDRIVLVMFALYGLAGGSVLYTSNLPSERMDHPAAAMNFPAILILVFIGTYLYGGDFVDPIRSHPITWISLFTVLWFFMGLAVYGLVRMLRLDSGEHTLKSSNAVINHCMRNCDTKLIS